MSDTNVHPLVPKIKRRVKTIRNRLRTSGPNHADTADLCGYVEQLAMWYEASQDMLGDMMHENTANVAALAEAERAQMERDCAELCGRCRHSAPLAVLVDTDVWLHTGVGVCSASMLRTAFAALHPEPPDAQTAAPAATLPACKGGTGTCTNEWCGPCYG